MGFTSEDFGAYVSKTDKGTPRIAKVHVDARSEEVSNFEVAENHTYLATTRR